MTRLKWLWWKLLRWLTKPWQPEDKVGNPRGKKRRGDSEGVLLLTNMMRAVNAMMVAVIIVAFFLLVMLDLG
jgi:hypothetical protein